MEYSQFGNTELTIVQLKELYSNHTHHDSLDDSSPLEKEFEVSFVLCLRIGGLPFSAGSVFFSSPDVKVIIVSPLHPFSISIC